MKSPHKSQIVTSDNHELTFILSEQVFEVSSISFHTGAQPSTPHIIECLADDTRWCRTDKIMQRSGAAAVHILIENLYIFKDFGVKKLILEFSDKS